MSRADLAGHNQAQQCSIVTDSQVWSFGAPWRTPQHTQATTQGYHHRRGARCISSKHLCASGVSEITCCSCHCQAAQSHANADRQACMPLVIHTPSVWFRHTEPTLPHTTCTVYQHQQQTNVFVLGLRGYAPLEMQATPYTTSLAPATHFGASKQQEHCKRDDDSSKQGTTKTPCPWARKCTQWGRSRSRLQSQPQDNGSHCRRLVVSQGAHE